MAQNRRFNQSPVGRQDVARTPNGRTGQAASVGNTGRLTPQGTRRSQRLQHNNQQAQGPSPQQVQQLRFRLSDALKEIKALKEENEDYEADHQSYRKVIEDKSSESAELRKRVRELEKQLASATQGAGWSFRNLVPRSRSTRQTEHEEHEKLQSRLEQQYKSNDSVLQTQNRKLREKDLQIKQLQAQIAEFAQELDNAKSKLFINVPQISDTEVQREWNALGCLIRQFVLKHLRGPLEPSVIQELANIETFRWLPESARTLRVSLLRPIVLESWIWHFLCFKVFDSKSEVWAGEVGKPFSALCDQIRCLLPNASASSDTVDATVEGFHDLRVRSAHFISQLITHDRRDMASLTAEAMLDALKAITPSTMSQDKLHHMGRDASSILKKAVELDQIFRLSKADFHIFITRVKLPLVSPPGFGFTFDPETMERVNGLPTFGQNDSESIVNLAVSPGIFKAGNSEGANYASERVLVKLQALCNLQTVLESFESPAKTPQITIKEDPDTEKMPVFIKKEETEDDDEVDMVQPKCEEMDYES